MRERVRRAIEQLRWDVRVCSIAGCPEIYPRDQGSRCVKHRREADRARGDRGYSSRGHRYFREQVLVRDPVCALCNAAEATVADHYPHSRRELIDAGLNPNDPQYGRGLCVRCHNRETAQHQPGGWHQG